MGYCSELQNCLIEAYKMLAEGGAVYKLLVQDFTTLIANSVGKEEGLRFKEYCEKEIKLGNFDPKMLDASSFMVYYGS